MFKKLVKMMLFVFVVCAFCSISGQVSYARKGRKQSVKAEQKAREESKLPTKWKPNSELRDYDYDGELLQIRRYGPDGRAIQDTDYCHSGPNHKFPHTHEWDWSKGDNNPNREDGVPLPGATELPPKKNNKNDKQGGKGQKRGRGKKRKTNLSKISKAAKKTAKRAAALGAAGTVVYFIISEGSRIVFPIRNFIPVL